MAIQTIPQKPAFVFDVDGVLARSGKAIPGATKSLQTLDKAGIPWIILTNGGGLTEDEQAKKLERQLDIPMSREQIVQSHTPFFDLLPEYRHKTILSIGGAGDAARHVATEYGFTSVVTSCDIFAADESIHPFPELSGAGLRALAKPIACFDSLRIEAILVFSSPRDWCLDMHVITDVLLGSGRVGMAAAREGESDGFTPKLFSCNPDITFASKHPRPRMAQDAFITCLDAQYRKLSGEPLSYETCGKPTRKTYEYAERTLANWHVKKSLSKIPSTIDTEKIAPSTISTVYMVGDNPLSDIAGAVAMANDKEQAMFEWKSVLVQTGVHTKGAVPQVVPTVEVYDVWQAVLPVIPEELLESC